MSEMKTSLVSQCSSTQQMHLGMKVTTLCVCACVRMYECMHLQYVSVCTSVYWEEKREMQRHKDRGRETSCYSLASHPWQIMNRQPTSIIPWFVTSEVCVLFQATIPHTINEQHFCSLVFLKPIWIYKDKEV